MAFWSMTSSSSMAGATEKLIDRESFTLPESLDCDDISNQVLAPNDRVIRYLSQPEIINELVDLALAPPHPPHKPEPAETPEGESETVDNESETGGKPAVAHDGSAAEEKTDADAGDDPLSAKPAEKESAGSDESEESEEKPTPSDSSETAGTAQSDEKREKSPEPSSYQSFTDDGGESYEYHEFQDDNHFHDHHNGHLSGEDEGDAVDEAEEEERQKRIRHSKISAEISTTDVWSLSDALLSNEQAMNKLWELLDASQPEASTQQLASLTKIVEGLSEKRLDRMLDFIRTLPHFVDYFIRYIECQPLIDFLIKVISTDHPESPTDIIDFSYDQDLVPKMIESLGPEVSHSMQSAAGDFLKAFVNISGGNKSDVCAIGPNESSRQFSSTKCMQRLIDLMSQGGHGMCVAVTVIIEVIRKNNSDYDFVEVMDTTLASHPPNPRDNIYLGTMVKSFARAIPKFQKMLETPEDRVMKMPFGEIKPLGFERFRICESYAELLHCSNMNLLNDPRGEEVIRERDVERVRVFFPDRLEQLDRDYAEAQRIEAEDVKLAKEHFIHQEGRDLLKSPGSSPETSKDSKHRRTASTDSADAQNDADSKGSKPDHERGDSDAKASKDTPKNELSEGSDASNDTNDLNNATSNGERSGSPGSPSAHPPYPEPVSPPNLISSPIESPSPPTPENESSDELGYVEAEQQKLNVSELRGEMLEQQLIRENGQLRERAVVGDQLKFALDDSECIDSVVRLSFDYPWNNFLHNVVFDIVQQVFNGYIDHSYNKFSAINSFKRAKITEQIVNGQRANDTHERERHIRLGYVGHLTLISEEVVKFESLFVPESISPEVAEALEDPAWNDYVKNDLLQLREQYNTVLGKAGTISEEEESFDIQEDDEGRVRALESNLIDDDDDDDDEDAHNRLNGLRRTRSDSDSDTDSESDSDSDGEDEEDVARAADADNNMSALTPQRPHRTTDADSQRYGHDDSKHDNYSDDDIHDDIYDDDSRDVVVDITHENHGPSESRAEREAERAAMLEQDRKTAKLEAKNPTPGHGKIEANMANDKMNAPGGSKSSAQVPEHEGEFVRYMSKHLSQGTRKFDSESSEEDEDEQQRAKDSPHEEGWTPIEK